MAQTREKFALYPDTPNTRSGAKVGWRYYDREIDAKACARAAEHNARIKEELGYDFGYCSPGSIRKVPDKHGTEFDGKYEVCVP